MSFNHKNLFYINWKILNQISISIGTIFCCHCRSCIIFTKVLFCLHFCLKFILRFFQIESKFNPIQFTKTNTTTNHSGFGREKYFRKINWFFIVLKESRSTNQPTNKHTRVSAPSSSLLLRNGNKQELEE